MTTLKDLKHKSCLILGTCQKYLVEFTEQTPTIYWYALSINDNTKRPQT